MGFPPQADRRGDEYFGFTNFARVAIFILFICLVLMSCDRNGIYNPSDTLSDIPVLEIRINPDAYLNFLGHKNTNYRVSADIYYEKELYHGSLRSSGAGSRLSPRWSYRVKLTDQQLINGLNEFNLSAQVNDRTMLNTTIVSELYRLAGFHTFDNHHVFVKINNRDQGLYQWIEIIEEPFFENRSLPVYELYKGEFDSKFSFTETYNPQFHYDKKIPDDNNFSTLYDLIYAVDTASVENLVSSLGKWIDIGQYLRYHALTSLINNPDAFRNNFFLYKETAQTPYLIIPWDFDRAFERGNNVGFYGKNALISKLFQNDSTFNMYKSELDNLLNTVFTMENIEAVLFSHAGNIRDAYNIDPYLGAGRFNFDQEIQSLHDYISNRRSFFIDNLPGFSKPLPED